jgi:hypothetical protein
MPTSAAAWISAAAIALGSAYRRPPRSGAVVELANSRVSGERHLGEHGTGEVEV